MRRRKHKKTTAKLGLLFVIILFSLASISMSYGAWTDTITIEGTVNTLEDFNYLCLEGYWTFNETSGTTAHDSSWNSNDGDVYGATWTPGKVNGALSFDGIDDYVEVPANDLTNNPMTMTWWMNTNDMQAVVFMDKDPWDADEGIEIWLYDNSGGYGYLNVRGSGGTNVVSSSDYHGEWVHVAVVFEDTTASIYQNGVFDTSGTIEQVTTSTHNFIIGMYGDKTIWPFNGLIDEVKVYSCALTADEIWDEYQAGL